MGPASSAADWSHLFDGTAKRGGDLNIPGSGVVPGSYSNHPSRLVHYTSLKSYSPNDLRTSAPPLPDAAAYPAASGTDSRGANVVLTAFNAFQRKMYSAAAPIISRASWGAARRIGRATAMTPTHVTVHHTEGPQTMTEAATRAAVRNIQWYHMHGRAREGKDTWDDIGYHFLIDGAGRVVEGRPANTVGAHARGANENNVGIALMGNFEKVRPTGAQLESLERLASFLAVKYHQDPTRSTFLEPHRHYDQTSCPGKNMMAVLGPVRQKVDGETDTLLAKLKTADPNQFVAVASAGL
jgi:hypothetical protein